MSLADRQWRDKDLKFFALGLDRFKNPEDAAWLFSKLESMGYVEKTKILGINFYAFTPKGLEKIDHGAIWGGLSRNKLADIARAALTQEKTDGL